MLTCGLCGKPSGWEWRVGGTGADGAQNPHLLFNEISFTLICIWFYPRKSLMIGNSMKIPGWPEWLVIIEDKWEELDGLSYLGAQNQTQVFSPSFIWCCSTKITMHCRVIPRVFCSLFSGNTGGWIDTPKRQKEMEYHNQSGMRL